MPNWKWGLKDFNYCWIVHLSLHFCEFLLHVFWFLLLCAYMFINVISSYWIDTYYKMSFFFSSNIFKNFKLHYFTIPTFLWLLLAWFVPLNLKCFSYRQHIVVSFVFSLFCGLPFLLGCVLHLCSMLLI